jgi:hypothetical protein
MQVQCHRDVRDSMFETRLFRSPNRNGVRRSISFL